MKERTSESLSALMDGEAVATGAIDELLASCDARATWARYHLIGDAMRDGLPARVDPGLAARVAARLAGEPALLAPQRRRPAFLKPLAAMAVAASVAGLAVVTFDRGPDTPAVAAVAAVAPPAAPTPAPPATLTPVPPVEVVRWAPPDAAAAARLNGYLVNYSEQRSTMAVPGVLPPYVRLVGHEVR